MKKYLYPIMALFVAHTFAQAEDNWTEFYCVQEGSNKSLKFIPETSETQEKQCTFFDGNTVWNYREILANGSSYRVTLHSGCSHEYLKPNALSTIEFRLPQDRKMHRHQRGGYYIPDMVTIPLNFSMILVGRNAQNETLFTDNYSCSASR